METTTDNIWIPDGALTTTHESCNILVNLLAAYGVKHAVISPGSRNAPIIIALNCCKTIKKHIIVDERSAAFAALGIAQQTNQPVVIICTSGTAVLNYAPAIAEAYYQQLPIIVISADRVHEWIDQNDSQTLKQFGILDNIVKDSYDISSHNDDTALWYANRTINDALQCAKAKPEGPVHINMQFSEPLYDRKCYPKQNTTRVITHSHVTRSLAQEELNSIAETLRQKRVLIVASMQQPSEELNCILNNLANENIVVLSEIIANNHQGDNILRKTDTLLTSIPETELHQYSPEVLITFGGAPVSRLLKTFLRKLNNIEHWRIGTDRNVIDTMQNLTKRIEVSPLQFFRELSKQNIHCTHSFYKIWQELSRSATINHAVYLKKAPWSDLKAMGIIMNGLPSKGLNLQVSNGSAIRYADIMGVPADFQGSVHCNRGVSGIDGSTSTALGASMVLPEQTTLLITGDMSFSYDLSGLASQYNSKNFKIIVLCNGGGGIFRFINGPSDLPEFEQYFEVHRDIPIDKYAAAFGFDFLQADNEVSLQIQLDKLLRNNAPTILATYTDNKISAQTLKDYYNRNKQK